MAQKKWQIRWGDLVLTENDITIGQAERIEKRAGVSWLVMNPWRSAVQAAAVATVLIADATEQREEDVAELVKAKKMTDFLEENIGFCDDDTPSMHEDGNPPVAGTSTGTSRTSRKSRGAGRQPSSETSPSGTSG